MTASVTQCLLPRQLVQHGCRTQTLCRVGNHVQKQVLEFERQVARHIGCCQRFQLTLDSFMRATAVCQRRQLCGGWCCHGSSSSTSCWLQSATKGATSCWRWRTKQASGGRSRAGRSAASTRHRKAKSRTSSCRRTARRCAKQRCSAAQRTKRGRRRGGSCTKQRRRAGRAECGRGAWCCWCSKGRC